MKFVQVIALTGCHSNREAYFLVSNCWIIQVSVVADGLLVIRLINQWDFVTGPQRFDHFCFFA